MSDENTKAAGPPESWEPVELESRKPVGVTISVRMPGPLFQRIERYAATHSVTVSEVIRQAAEAFLMRPTHKPVVTLVATASASLNMASPYAAVGGSTWGSQSTIDTLLEPA